MGFSPIGPLIVIAVWGVPAAVISVLLYLVLRFGIRDGLRGHRLWLERTGRGPADTPKG